MQIAATEQRRTAQQHLFTLGRSGGGASLSRQTSADIVASTTGSALFFVDSCTERQLLGIHKRATSAGSGTGLGGTDSQLKRVDETKEDVAVGLNIANELVSSTSASGSRPKHIITTSPSMNAAEISTSLESFVSPTPHRLIPLVVDAETDVTFPSEGAASEPSFLFSEVQSEPTRSPPVIVSEDPHEILGAVETGGMGHRYSASTGNMSDFSDTLAEAPDDLESAVAALDVASKRVRMQSHLVGYGQLGGTDDTRKPLGKLKQYGSESQILSRGKTPVLAKLYANIKRGSTGGSAPNSPLSAGVSEASTFASERHSNSRCVITPADSIDVHGYFLGDNDVDGVSSEGDVSSPSQSWRGGHYMAGEGDPEKLRGDVSIGDGDLLLLDEEERASSGLSDMASDRLPCASGSFGMRKAASLDQITTTYAESSMDREGDVMSTGALSSVFTNRPDSHSEELPKVDTAGAMEGAGFATPHAPSPVRTASMRRSKDTSHMRKSSHKSSSGNRGLSETVWSILRQQVSRTD